jgi:hypothetical protein
MKELEVKAMLADPNIPDSYKLGGRLDERFSAGVEYAEAAIEKAPELWITKDKGGTTSIFSRKPSYDENYDCFIPISFEIIDKPWLPEVTFEDSPCRVKLILMDEQ